MPKPAPVLIRGGKRIGRIQGVYLVRDAPYARVAAELDCNREIFGLVTLDLDLPIGMPIYRRCIELGVPNIDYEPVQSLLEEDAAENPTDGA